MAVIKKADILENKLRKIGDLLDILLFDQTTRNNIYWATDSYQHYGRAFNPYERIKPQLVTGEKYGLLIQPRAVKNLEEQYHRTKKKGEVFTPLNIVEQMYKICDIFPINKSNWKTYVSELRLEIACGEAPFIVTRYNPVAHGTVIKTEKRVGFLDQKLQVISKYCDSPREWLKWTKVAYQSSYGYEWQGDSLLIARENLLYTLIDYHKEKFGHNPSIVIIREFAKIISWNIFQMDGLKFVIPMSCHSESKATQGELPLFGGTPTIIKESECDGCKHSQPNKHNGIYVKIMDWKNNKVIRFVDLIK